MENLNTKQVGIWAGGLVIFLVIVYALSTLISENSSSTQEQGNPLDEPVSSEDHAKGNPEADVVLVEYGDFQCPACKNYSSVFESLSTQFADNALFVYRHFPLPIHKYANNAAKASEAAALQDKFWEMHDKLFEKQDEWSASSDIDSQLATYAEEIGLDVERFREDYNSKNVQTDVDDDRNSGVKSGVNSTPSFYLNGFKINNPRSPKEFQQIIENAIALAESERTKLDEAEKNKEDSLKEFEAPKGNQDER